MEKVKCIICPQGFVKPKLQKLREYFYEKTLLIEPIAKLIGSFTKIMERLNAIKKEVNTLPKEQTYICSTEVLESVSCKI